MASFCARLLRLQLQSNENEEFRLPLFCLLKKKKAEGWSRPRAGHFSVDGSSSQGKLHSLPRECKYKPLFTLYAGNVISAMCVYVTQHNSHDQSVTSPTMESDDEVQLRRTEKSRRVMAVLKVFPDPSLSFFFVAFRPWVFLYVLLLLYRKEPMNNNTPTWA